jgi:hypothetical protein
VRIDAATMINVICMRNDMHSTQRRLGEKYRWKRLKQKYPTQKDTRGTLDLIHRFDSFGAAKPSPM